jgi:elongator complex protein 1
LREGFAAYKHTIPCQITLHKKPELIESTLHPGLDDAHEQFVDTFDEMETQLGKELARIAELKQKLDQDPGETF